MKGNTIREAILVGMILLLGAGLRAQDSRPVPPPRPQVTMPAMADMRRRLVELDRLLTLKSVGRAESLIEELSMFSLLERDLIPRRIKLAQLRDDHLLAVELSREALENDPQNSGLWRFLTTSLLAVDQPDSARLAAGQLIATGPNQRSSGMVSVELFQESGHPRMAVDLIDSLRAVFGDQHFLGRRRAVELLALNRQNDAADEVVADLRHNPYNLPLVRNEILESGHRVQGLEMFLERLRHRSQDTERQVPEVLLAANLHLMVGDSAAAWSLVRPLLDARSNMSTCLDNAVTLTRELPLLAEDDDRRPELQATTDYLLEILGFLSRESNFDRGIRQRAANHLASVCEIALENRILGDDPQAAAGRFDDLLGLVRQAHPQSEHLYSSRIKLATFTRDELGKPKVAARRLESMLLDLDLPLPGVALVRLTLGECYLAAGDTARGRVVLTSLGRDPEFRQSAGHAHYHLARLDLAQGNLTTAKDRFAVVALENPAAPYANDALELGLAITEEMENPSGGPDFMLQYSQSVYYDLVAKPLLRMEALEGFIATGLERLDLTEPQHLLERARFELARAYAERDRFEEAVELCRAIAREHPDGRFPGEALMLQSRLEHRLGRDNQARDTLELLLAQYPDFLFVDDARDVLRSLP